MAFCWRSPVESQRDVLWIFSSKHSCEPIRKTTESLWWQKQAINTILSTHLFPFSISHIYRLPATEKEPQPSLQASWTRMCLLEQIKPRPGGDWNQSNSHRDTLKLLAKLQVRVFSASPPPPTLHICISSLGAAATPEPFGSQKTAFNQLPTTESKTNYELQT